MMLRPRQFVALLGLLVGACAESATGPLDPCPTQLPSTAGWRVDSAYVLRFRLPSSYVPVQRSGPDSDYSRVFVASGSDTLAWWHGGFFLSPEDRDNPAYRSCSVALSDASITITSWRKGAQYILSGTVSPRDATAGTYGYSASALSTADLLELRATLQSITVAAGTG